MKNSVRSTAMGYTTVRGRGFSRCAAMLAGILMGILNSSSSGEGVAWDENTQGDMPVVLPALQLGVNEVIGEVGAVFEDTVDEAQFVIPEGWVLKEFLIAESPGIGILGPSISIHLGPVGSMETIESIDTASFHVLPLDLLRFDSAPGPQPAGVYSFGIVRVTEATGAFVIHIVTELGVCPSPNDCCVENATPGCNDVTCCETVCAVDSFCCTDLWDGICALEADDLCGQLCDICPGSGDCCASNGTPGCTDADCCDTVCTADSFCCFDNWDGLCAQQAADLCGGCTVGACCLPEQDIGACCCPQTNLGCIDSALNTDCSASGCVYLGTGTDCATAECPCDGFPEPCDWCWIETIFENNCPSEWNGSDDGCDCGCQFTDPDCSQPELRSLDVSTKPEFNVARTREAAVRNQPQIAGQGGTCVDGLVADRCGEVLGSWAGSDSDCTEPGLCDGLGSCAPDCSKQSVECLNPGPRYDNRTIVGRLLFTSVPVCTGWIVASNGVESVVMTNNHCVIGNPTLMDIEFNLECDACVNGFSKSTQTFAVTELIRANPSMDYALLRVAGDPAAQFGIARIDPSAQFPDLAIYEIHHAGALPKGYDEGTVTGIGVNACVQNEDSVTVIASAGASGSPVFRQDNDCVSAICNCGDPCEPGFVIPMSRIIPNATPFLAAAGFSFTFCDDCAPIGLLASKYACNDSLSRFGNNVLRFTFDANLPGGPPAPGEIEIRELLEGGLFGPDISAQFVFSIEDDNVLKIVEPGQVFTNESWYAVMNTGGWCDAEDFEVDYAVVYGDANNDHVTGFTDLSAINASMSDPIDTEDNNRFDINTDGQVSFTDLSAANEFNGSIALIDNKPTGHGCSP